MTDLKTCLWFDGRAEEAAHFYASVLPDTAIGRVVRSPGDYPGGRQGDVLTVEFRLLGRPFLGLNGGPHVTFNPAVSLMLPCADQAEIDRHWDALQAGGGKPVQCGWLQDRFGLSWQVYPAVLDHMLADPDRAAARRAFEAMTQMVKIDLATIERAFRGED